MKDKVNVKTLLVTCYALVEAIAPHDANMNELLKRLVASFGQRHLLVQRCAREGSLVDNLFYQAWKRACDRITNPNCSGLHLTPFNVDGVFYVRGCQMVTAKRKRGDKDSSESERDDAGWDPLKHLAVVATRAGSAHSYESDNEAENDEAKNHAVAVVAAVVAEPTAAASGHSHCVVPTTAFPVVASFPPPAVQPAVPPAVHPTVPPPPTVAEEVPAWVAVAERLLKNGKISTTSVRDKVVREASKAGTQIFIEDLYRLLEDQRGLPADRVNELEEALEETGTLVA